MIIYQCEENGGRGANSYIELTELFINKKYSIFNFSLVKKIFFLGGGGGWGVLKKQIIN